MKKESYEFYKVEKVNSVKEILDMAVEKAGNQIAFKYKEDKKIKEVTYNEFQEDTIALGTALCSIDMCKSHIATIGENSYKWITTYLAVLKSEGVFVPVDKELPYKDIVHVLQHSDSELLFYSSTYEKYIQDLKKDLPNVKYFIGFNRLNTEGNVFSYNEFINKGREMFKKGDKTYLSLKSDEYALKLLVYTSGTTGMAKGVMLSEHNLVSCVYYGLQVSTVYDRCLSVLPYHHTYEAVAGILVSLHHHSTICINDSLKNVLKNLQLYKPDYIYLVPAFVEVFYKKIWSNAKESKKEFGLKLLLIVSKVLRKLGIDKRKKLFATIHNAFGGNLRKIVTGGAPIRKELGIFFNDIGIDLINGYGITECSPLVSANVDGFNDCATVGVVLPCCKIKLENVDEEGNGEICVKGDIVMKGYYKNEALTNEVLKDGWFNTGDYGRVNNKGQLIINGRKKNLIVLENGKNVFPEEIENYIMNIPYVAEVVVHSSKNEHSIENGLCAEVFLNEEKIQGMENIEETLRKDIAEVTRPLPVYKHIGNIVIREKEFEKTTTNKIKR